MSAPGSARNLFDSCLLRLIDSLGTEENSTGDVASFEAAPAWFHDGQREAWACEDTDIVVVAGTQGGKTAIQAPWLLREIARCAPAIRQLGNGKFIYAGPTLTLLEQQAIPSFVELFEETYRLGKLIRGNKPKFVFSRDGLQRVLGFSHCPVTVNFAYTNDSSNLESMTALAGVWDEAGQKENKLASFRAFNRRLKVARSMGYGRRLWGTTPYEWGWFKTNVVDVAERRDSGYRMFNFPSWMNPIVSEEECRKDLDQGMPLWEWQMMYLGLYTKPAGIIYDSFDSERMLVTRFEFPDHWPRWIGLDFGLRNTAAIFVAEELDSEGKPTGRLIRYRTYKPGHNRSVEDHVRELLKGEPRLPIAVGGSHTEADVRAAFRLAGLPVEEPPVSDVEAGILCVYGEHSRGETLVFNDLADYLDEKLSYSRELGDDGKPTDKIRDKASYHLMDAERYLMSKLRPIDPSWVHNKTAMEYLMSRVRSENS